MRLRLKHSSRQAPNTSWMIVSDGSARLLEVTGLIHFTAITASHSDRHKAIRQITCRARSSPKPKSASGSLTKFPPLNSMASECW